MSKDDPTTRAEQRRITRQNIRDGAAETMPDPNPPTPDTDSPDADPLEGAVEVDWQRPLDEWETAFKDELFLWTPFFRGLGHGHMRLDANARYALARIAGILHRRSALEAEHREVERLREALSEIFAKANDDHWSSAGAIRWISERCLAALAPSTPQPSTEIENPKSETAAEGTEEGDDVAT